jgi:hypothetical protein
MSLWAGGGILCCGAGVSLGLAWTVGIMPSPSAVWVRERDSVVAYFSCVTNDTVPVHIAGGFYLTCSQAHTCGV